MMITCFIGSKKIDKNELVWIRRGYILKAVVSGLAILIIYLIEEKSNLMLVLVLLSLKEMLTETSGIISGIGWKSFFTRIAEKEIGGTFTGFLNGVNFLGVIFSFTIGSALSGFLNVYIIFIL